MKFGEELKRIRKDRGLSIRKTGELTGISHAYLSQIENGKRPKPKPEIIKKLANALNESYVGLMEKAGYLEDLTPQEKESLIINEEYQNHLDKKLEMILQKISINNEFLPELKDEIENIEGYFDNAIDGPITPSFLRELIANADWRQEWIQDLVKLLENLSRGVPNASDISEFLSQTNIVYKNIPFDDNDRKLLQVYLNTLFANRLNKEE